MNDFSCISINYKLCDEGVRSRFAFSEQLRKTLIKDNPEKCPVILCTCNRTEIYFHGDISFGIELISSAGGITVGDIKEKLMIYSGSSAITHLFSVSCGIDSMVIGEDEILGQVKKAYLFSYHLIPLSSECNMIFQTAFAAAKRIKTETELSRTSVSTATLAAKTAARLNDRVTVMLIGASGELGGKILKNLLSYKNVSVIVTKRKHNQNISIAADKNMSVIDYEKRYEEADKCDCIISATSGPHYTITAEKLLDSISENKRLTLIDLAVPRDIDNDLEKINNIDMIGIDSFETLAEKNNKLKLSSAERSRIIISEEADKLKKQLDFHKFRKQTETDLNDISAEDLIYKLKSELDHKEFAKVLEAIKEMVG